MYNALKIYGQENDNLLISSLLQSLDATSSLYCGAHYYSAAFCFK